jgi:C3HC4-type zinc finger (RING finger) protein
MNLDLATPKAENDDHVLDAEVDEDHCTICLQAIVDRALIPECSHEFCFECLMIWSGKNPFSSPQILSQSSKKHIRPYYRTI